MFNFRNVHFTQHFILFLQSNTHSQNLIRSWKKISRLGGKLIRGNEQDQVAMRNPQNP